MLYSCVALLWHGQVGRKCKIVFSFSVFVAEGEAVNDKEIAVGEQDLAASNGIMKREAVLTTKILGAMKIQYQLGGPS